LRSECTNKEKIYGIFFSLYSYTSLCWRKYSHYCFHSLKGKSGIAWVILVFALGWLAILALEMLPDLPVLNDNYKNDFSNSDHGSTWTCKKCGDRNALISSYCKG